MNVLYFVAYLAVFSPVFYFLGRGLERSWIITPIFIVGLVIVAMPGVYWAHDTFSSSWWLLLMFAPPAVFWLSFATGISATTKKNAKMASIDS